MAKLKHHCINHPDRTAIMLQRNRPVCWECADIDEDVKRDRCRQYYGDNRNVKIGRIKRA